jgi:hypothetical protein
MNGDGPAGTENNEKMMKNYGKTMKTMKTMRK